jgi:translation initiation factor 2 subunit 1
MIHVSEISAKWVKNIREYAKEGQTLIVKVLRVDKHKGHVDLSLKSVNASQRKLIVDARKQDQKAQKLVELAAEDLKDKDAVKEILKQLDDNFDGAYDALLQIKKDGIKVLKDMGISEKWVKALGKISEEHVTIPKVSIKVIMELKANGPDGIDAIKNALAKAKEQVPEEIEAVFKYVGAPKYKIEMTALDYKTLEKCLDKITKTVTKEMTGNNGTAVVEKQK